DGQARPLCLGGRDPVGLGTGQIDQEDACRLGEAGRSRLAEGSRLEILRKVVEERGRHRVWHVPDNVASHQRTMLCNRPLIVYTQVEHVRMLRSRSGIVRALVALLEMQPWQDG